MGHKPCKQALKQRNLPVFSTETASPIMEIARYHRYIPKPRPVIALAYLGRPGIGAPNWESRKNLSWDVLKRANSRDGTKYGTRPA